MQHSIVIPVHNEAASIGTVLEGRSAALRDGCADTACGLNLCGRKTFLPLPSFEGMRRFLPALFRAYGYAIDSVSVVSRPRLHGPSCHGNPERGVAGLFDPSGVLWLTRRIHAPQVVERTVQRTTAAIHEVT